MNIQEHNQSKSNKAGYTDYVLPLESPKGKTRDAANTEGAAHAIQTDFADLGDGRLLELVEDPADPERTLLAVWERGTDREIEYVREFKHADKTFVPRRRNTQVLKSIRLPRYALPYVSPKIICEDLEKLISQCIDVPLKYVPVLADFILSTWFVDRFQVAPYLSIVGLPQSGKTTLLKFLSLLCQRPLLIGDITELSLYQACSELMPTILIDEAATIRNNSALRHLLRIGTTKDALSVRGKRTFHTFGAKVISWLEPPQDLALNSRCIQIALSETRRTDLLRLTDPRLDQAAETLRAQLLQYRLENYSMVSVAEVEGDEVLRPRSRDILRSLCAAHFRNPQRSESLLKLLASGEAVPQEHLDPEPNAVLRALFSIIHFRKDFASIQTGDFTNSVNYFLQRAGEKLRLQPRKVGAVLKSLGFANRKRTHLGWMLSLDQSDAKKIHQLADCYGIHDMSDRALVVSRDECALCRATAKRNSMLAPPNPNERSTTMDLRRELGHF